MGGPGPAGRTRRGIELYGNRAGKHGPIRVPETHQAGAFDAG